MLVSLKVQGLRAAAMVKGNFQRLHTSNLLKKKLCILSQNLLAFMICETFLPSFSSQEWAGQVEISALSLMYK